MSIRYELDSLILLLNIDKKYKDLNEREYKCSKCHNIIDRDLNASINIMFEGLKLYMKNEVKI